MNAEYADYLRGDEWKGKRRRVLERAEGQCERKRCSRKASQVHHRTYRRIFQEMLTDLEALCGRCHMKAHGIGKRRQPPRVVARRRAVSPVVASGPLKRGPKEAVADFRRRRIREALGRMDPAARVAWEVEHLAPVQTEDKRCAKEVEKDEAKARDETLRKKQKTRNKRLKRLRAKQRTPRSAG